jgi:hypothetical protein
MGRAAPTLDFCRRACAQVLDGKWEDLVANTESIAVSYPSSIRLVMAEVGRGILPLAVIAPFVVMRVPPVEAFDLLLYFGVLWAVVTMLRLIDPALREKLADAKLIQELLKR